MRCGSMMPWSFTFAALAVLSTQYSVLSTDSSAPAFDLHTADCTTYTGPLLKLQPDWSATIGGPKPVQLPGPQFVSVRRADAPLPPHPLGEHLVLIGGDRVTGTVLGLRDERLRFRLTGGQEAVVPLTRVAILWLAAPEREDDAELFLRRLAAQRRTRDVVLLRNGDAVEGTLNELDAKGLRVDAQGKDVRVERGKVAAVALNSELSQPVRSKGTYGHLVLADGSRLSLAAAQSDGKTLTGKTLFGVTLSVPLEQVIALDVRQGAATYLSDLKPKSYEHTPYLGVRWPFVPDASVTGQPLRLVDGTYDKGIGLHSASRLTYDLAGGYRWFTARVGLDARTGREGGVRLRVLVDGKPADLGDDRELTGRDPPRDLRVPVTGARELTLVVEFGTRGDVGDHVNWADARLLK